MGRCRRRRKERVELEQRAQLAQLVLESLQFLKEHTGWTTRALAGFIRQEPRAAALAAAAGCSHETLGRRVASVLTRGVRLGVFQKNGTRYRLHSKTPTAKSLSRCRKKASSRSTRASSNRDSS